MIISQLAQGRIMKKTLLVTFLIFFNISSAYPNCELLNSSFDLSSKQEITKSDKAFIFMTDHLTWRGLFKKMKSIYPI